MATVLSKGVIVPDPGETDWAGYLAINWGKLNDVVGAALPDVQNIWTQPQIFQNNAYLTNTSYTVGTIPDSNITTTLFFAGASNYQIGYCRGVVYKTTGQTSAELTARNKFTNGVLDPAGSYINATFTVNLDADGTRWIQFANSSIKNGLIPYATDTYNIGSAANQWLKLFAKFYYYNGVAWGLDQANTWTAMQTIHSGSEAILRLKRTNLKIGDEIPQSTQVFGTLAFSDSDNYNLGLVTFRDETNGNTRLILIARQRYDANGNRSNNGTLFESRVETGIDSSQNLYFRPYTNKNINLGDFDHQWKTFNGLNPGALSLPNKDNSVDITSEFTDLTGGDIFYIPPADGWITITADNEIFCAVVSSTHRTTFWCQSASATSISKACVTIPVKYLQHFRARIKSTNAITVTFYPCLGNV